MINPLVTILMPCKDPKPNYFREAIKSVMSQTSKNWRLIIVDDHSSAVSTKQLFQEVNTCADKRITIIKNESRFITGALNTGMRHAKTPYVCSLHCDDLLSFKAIQTLNSGINKFRNVKYFYSSRKIINAKGEVVSTLLKARKLSDPSDFIRRSPVKPIHCWEVAAALSVGGVDESLGLQSATDDYDFPWSMAEAGYLFKAMPECLYYYRDHYEHHRLTTHIPLQMHVEELIKIFKKHNLSDSEIADQISRRRKRYLK